MEHYSAEMVEPASPIEQPGAPLLVIERTADCEVIGRHSKSTTGDSSELPPNTLYGYPAIDAYVESCLERYETDDDTAAGLRAVTVLTMFDEHYGHCSPEVYDAIASSVVATTDPDTLYDLIVQTMDADTPVADRLADTVSTRIGDCQTLDDLYRDPLVTSYLRAHADMSGRDEIEVLASLLELPKPAK